MKKILFIIIIINSVVISQSQRTIQHRYSKQTYLDDSIHVYWNQFPNPFSPPTVTSTKKCFIQGDLTFYCDLSDSVEVAFITKKDSIVHKAVVTSSKPPYFSIGYWVAGPNISQHLLPISYFLPRSDDNIRLVIIVGGRWRSIRQSGIQVRSGWRYWIDSPKINKH